MQNFFYFLVVVLLRLFLVLISFEFELHLLELERRGGELLLEFVCLSLQVDVFPDGVLLLQHPLFCELFLFFAAFAIHRDGLVFFQELKLVFIFFELALKPLVILVLFFTQSLHFFLFFLLLGQSGLEFFLEDLRSV